jgi:predicted DNA helicase
MLSFNNAKEELLNTLRLLDIEKNEELRLYEELIRQSNIDEKRKKGVCWYPLQIVETGYGYGEYPYIIAERTSHKEIEHSLGGGKPVELFSTHPLAENPKQKATIHYVAGNRLKIFINGDELPDWVQLGKIGVQLMFDAYSYTLMEKALKQVIEAKNSRLEELRDYILAYNPLPTLDETSFETLYVPELNYSQNEAIRYLLSEQNVGLIHGPPGTGKTTTLIKTIELICRKEKQVLVCAPSNTAADLVAERLANEGLRVTRIGNLSRIDEGIINLTLEYQSSQHKDTQIIKKLKSQAEEYKRLASKYKRNFGRDERNQRKELQKEARRLIDDALKIEEYLSEAILDNSQCIVTTLVGSDSKELSGRKFSTVVIDEAAQALEPACWIPILKAQRVIMAGDPFQLPPTVKSNVAAQGGLNITLLEKAIKRKTKNSLLKVQYRMNEKIMGFSNIMFYNGNLEAHSSVAFQSLGILELPEVTFIDTAGASFDEVLNEESKSLFNIGEAETLVKILKNDLNLIQNLDLEFLDIGVISPYREQVRYLETLIANELEIPVWIDLDINTIDSFQGQEKDIIMISCVRSNVKNEIGFLSDYRRMNVALTRAKKRLVIIGDSATLGNDSFYEKLLEYTTEIGAYKSVYELNHL